MTPEKKAIELVEKYRKLWIESSEHSKCNMSLHLLSSSNLAYIPFIKQCALIAVDEILNVELMNTKTREYIIAQSIGYFDYWQQVRKEIENL